MLKDKAPKGAAASVRRARALRSDMSLPEVMLWRLLRGRPGGLKFRRQHPSGRLVLDFYCEDARLAVEIDGEAHLAADRGIRDEARDTWMRAAGIATLRLPAKDVLNDPDGALGAIVTAAVARLPLHHPAAPGGPPPRAELGEDA